MGNYFARDDALDPALSTVCQALRGDNYFEYMLRRGGGSFQSLASAYYHLKLPRDRDLSGRTSFGGRAVLKIETPPVEYPHESRCDIIVGTFSVTADAQNMIADSSISAGDVAEKATERLPVGTTRGGSNYLIWEFSLDSQVVNFINFS